MYMYSQNVLIKKCTHVILKSSEQTIHPSCDSDSHRFLLILCACSVCRALQVLSAAGNTDCLQVLAALV